MGLKLKKGIFIFFFLSFQLFCCHFISILINLVWFSSIIELTKEIYPGTWYNIESEEFFPSSYK